jgi:hypothetical protein
MRVVDHLLEFYSQSGGNRHIAIPSAGCFCQRLQLKSKSLSLKVGINLGNGIAFLFKSRFDVLIANAPPASRQLKGTD